MAQNRERDTTEGSRPGDHDQVESRRGIRLLVRALVKSGGGSHKPFFEESHAEVAMAGIRTISRREGGTWTWAVRA
jgi:hypothetical protein